MTVVRGSANPLRFVLNPDDVLLLLSPAVLLATVVPAILDNGHLYADGGIYFIGLKSSSSSSN
eukprot:scaffold3225_cov65-Cyclotella_meneghiniana.AAC.19